MILQCSCCKTNFRFDPSPFTGWKSARVRCRMCGEGFTIVFPATEPAEPPRQPQAFTVTRGTPGTAFRPGTDTQVSTVSPPESSPRSLVQPAGSLGVLVAEKPDTAIPPSPPGDTGATGDALSVPHSEAPPTFLFQTGKTPPLNRWNTRPPVSFWHLVAVPVIYLTCYLAAAILIYELATSFPLLAFFDR
jgi:hypothetical protein